MTFRPTRVWPLGIFGAGGGIMPDVPAGVIAGWSGAVAAIPATWALCDGTNGTPDLVDFMIVGADAATVGLSGGTISPAVALPDHDDHITTQPGAHIVTQPGAHAAHIVTQPGAHAAHIVTQPNDHLDVLNHVHRENRNSATTGALDGWAAGDTSTNTPTLTGYSTANPTAGGVAAQVHAGAAVDGHSAHAGAAVDGHSAHAGTAVDAHSGTDVDSHSVHAAIKWYALAWIMKL